MWDKGVDGVCRWLCRTFPSRARTIPRIDGKGPLLTQFVLIKDRAFLQHFHGPDQENPHYHRWGKMRSFVLSAGFKEERHYLHLDKVSIFTGEFIHRRFETYTMRRGTIHRVSYWHPLCWTLFLVSGTYINLDTGEPDWGYLDLKTRKFVPWQEAIPQELRVRSI